MATEGTGPGEGAAQDARSGQRASYELGELLAISRAMSSERDIRKLLDLILAKSRQITGADAGSVYVVEEAPAAGERPSWKLPVASAVRVLHFMLSQNDSITIDLKEFRLPVDETSIVGQAVLQRQPINIADLAQLSQPGRNPGGFQHNRSVDDRTGYRARSMLTVPMLSARDEVIGVIQLINRKTEAGRRLLAPEDFTTAVVPFDARSQELALAVAAQAGVCLENAILYEEIRNLFEGFVDASVTAIESRDPTTSGHSRRVATLSVGLAEKVDAVVDGPFKNVRFSREDLRQIEYAGVLHDFGKVGVRESVLVKAKKLYEWQRAGIELRFRYIRKALEAEALERKLGIALRRTGASPLPMEELLAIDAEAGGRVAELDEALALVRTANEPALLGEPVAERLEAIAKLEYVDVDGARRPYLEPDEIEALRVRKGSLTGHERKEIESHVSHTISFLETIPWGRTFEKIPRIAGGHHELLDGRGYPFGLKGEEIALESRMLTIADIFDALTAADRPYKPAVPVPKALAILESEVKAGRCDAELFKVFVGAEVYRKVS
jgi:HD-GYP domain-containing protein (c-di-GMP phosphodiesterase class II)